MVQQGPAPALPVTRAAFCTDYARVIQEPSGNFLPCELLSDDLITPEKPLDSAPPAAATGGWNSGRASSVGGSKAGCPLRGGREGGSVLFLRAASRRKLGGTLTTAAETSTTACTKAR